MRCRSKMNEMRKKKETKQKVVSHHHKWFFHRFPFVCAFHFHGKKPNVVSLFIRVSDTITIIRNNNSNFHWIFSPSGTEKKDERKLKNVSQNTGLIQSHLVDVKFHESCENQNGLPLSLMREKICIANKHPYQLIDMII